MRRSGEGATGRLSWHERLARSSETRRVIALVVLTAGAVAVGLGAAPPAARAATKMWTTWTVRRHLAQRWGDLASTTAVVRRGSGPAVIEFADYECEVCRQTFEAMDTIKLSATLLYRHLPLTTIHPAAEGAALAAICAARQGRFTEVHRILMTTRAWMRDRDWARVAREAGIPSPAALITCVASREAAETLAADVAIARSLRINATPTFVTRSEILVGARGLSLVQHGPGDPRR